MGEKIRKFRVEDVPIGEGGIGPGDIIDTEPVCDYEFEAWAPVGVGAAYRGKRYSAQAGDVEGNPNAGKGSM